MAQITTRLQTHMMTQGAFAGPPRLSVVLLRVVLRFIAPHKQRTIDNAGVVTVIIVTNDS